MNPKTLRTMAITMLELADALDEGKVQFLHDSQSNVRHMYFKPSNFSAKLCDEPIPPDMKTGVICEHELRAYASYFVGVKCNINGQFFINENLCKVLERNVNEVLL